MLAMPDLRRMAKRERIDVSGTRIEIILKLCSKLADVRAEERAAGLAKRGQGKQSHVITSEAEQLALEAQVL
jgi:hypothetical protein